MQRVQPAEDLSALLYQPNEVTSPIGLVLTHGLTSSAASMDLLANYLCEKGVPVMCPDLPGHILGASTRPMHGFSDACLAVQECADYARQLWSMPVVLAGHSLGGAASLCVAAEQPHVAGAVGITIGLDAGRGFNTPIGLAMRASRQSYLVGCTPELMLSEVRSAMHGFTGIGGRPLLLVSARGDVIMSEEEIQQLALQCQPVAQTVQVNATHLTAPDACKVLLLRFLSAM